MESWWMEYSWRMITRIILWLSTVYVCFDYVLCSQCTLNSVQLQRIRWQWQTHWVRPLQPWSGTFWPNKYHALRHTGDGDDYAVDDDDAGDHDRDHDHDCDDSNDKYTRLMKHILFNFSPTFVANHIKVFSVQETQRNTVRNVQSAPCVENLITKF